MSTETLASHVDCDEVARLALIAEIKAHLPCKERAAADLSAPEVVRRAVREEIAEDRTALALLGADLRNDTERNGTNHD